MTGSTGITVPGEAGVGAASAAATGVVVIPDGEVVILRLRPHVLFIVLSVMGPLMACGAVAVGLAWISGRWVALPGNVGVELPSLGRIWLLPVVVGVGVLGWQTLEWWCRGYVLTDRRVVRVSGVLRQIVVDVPLPRVQQVMLYRSLRERVFGLGTPGVSSAGSGALSFAFWNMVGRPHERMRVLRETIERYGGGHGENGGGQSRAPACASGGGEAGPRTGGR